MVTRLKHIDQKAVENHVNGAVWAFDYDKMFCVLMENEICRKVCEKNKYNNGCQSTYTTLFYWLKKSRNIRTKKRKQNEKRNVIKQKRIVDSPTTATVQTIVFFRTIEKAGLPRTFWKLSKPQKPLIRPALLILLKDMRNTNPIGTTIKTAINNTLGRIHI